MRMETSCRQARRLASVRRECTVEDRSRLKEHLSDCPNCQTAAHEFELMDRRLGRLPEPAFAAVPPAFARAQSAAAGRARSAPPWPGWRRVIQPLSLVTVLAVVTIAAIAWFGPPTHQALPAGLGTLLVSQRPIPTRCCQKGPCLKSLTAGSGPLRAASANPTHPSIKPSI
jgi:anti-sigma factor RsiW